MNEFFVWLNGMPYFPGTLGIGTGLFGDGSAATPSISFLNDTGTGFFRVGVGQIGFAPATGVAVTNLNSITAAASTNLTLGTTNAAIVSKYGASAATSYVDLTAFTKSGSSTTAAAVIGKSLGLSENLYAGGLLNVAGAATFQSPVSIGDVTTNSHLTFTRSINTANAILHLITGVTDDFLVGLRNTGDSDFHIYSFGTSSNVLTIARATGATTLAGNLTVGGSQSNLGGDNAAASTQTQFVKAVAAIADGVSTAVLTVTIPNAAHSALIKVSVASSLGAGGAIGANEASGTQVAVWAVARTAGVNAVTAASAAYGASSASVAGATTIATAFGTSAIAGAVGAVNTFTVNVTITAGAAGPTNHTCLVCAEILNANATGITLS